MLYYNSVDREWTEKEVTITVVKYSKKIFIFMKFLGFAQ